MTTPAVREVVAAAWAAGTSGRSVTTGAATAAGDLLLAFVAVDYFNSGSNDVAAPSGTWATVAATTITSGKTAVACYSQTVTTAGAQTVTIDNAGDGVSDSETALVVYVLSDASVEGSATARSGSEQTSQPAASVTTTGPDDLLIAAWAAGTYQGGNSYTAAPAGMTQDYTGGDPGTYLAALACHEDLTTTGATGTRTATYSPGASTSTGWAAVTAAVKSAGGAPAIEELTGTVTLGTAVSATAATPAASVPGLSGTVSSGTAINAALAAPAASVAELSGSLTATTAVTGTLTVGEAGIPGLAGSIDLATAATGLLTTPSAGLADLAGTVGLATQLTGALAVPPAGVPELAGTLALTASVTGLLQAPGTGPARDITVTAGPVTSGWAAAPPAGGWQAPTIGSTDWTATPPAGDWTAESPVG